MERSTGGLGSGCGGILFELLVEGQGGWGGSTAPKGEEGDGAEDGKGGRFDDSRLEVDDLG